MKNILEKYNSCDVFSLSGYRGIYTISAEEAEQIIKITKQQNRKQCRRIWELIKSKDGLPSFEQIIEDIENEITNFDAYEFTRRNCPSLFEGLGRQTIEKTGENKYRINSTNKMFIVDTVGQTTRYGQEFYHMYAILSEEIDQIELVKALQNIKEKGNNLIDSDSKYEILKPYIKYKEISFNNHCTISSCLFETYYFELNDLTKQWLLNYKDVFSFDGEPLEDFALYKDKKLKFSSCTHEGYSTEIKEEQK